MSRDGRRVAFDDSEVGEIVVRDVANDDEIARLPSSGVRELNRDGSLLLTGDAPIEVWDVMTGGIVTRFDGHGGESRFARFGPSGTTVLSTGVDGTLREWDAITGVELFAYPGIGSGRPSFTADGRVLVVRLARDTAALLDTRRRGEVAAYETCTGRVPPDALHVIEGIAVVPVACDENRVAITHVVDLDGGEVRTISGHQAEAVAVSPDGRRFVRHEGRDDAVGPLVVREAGTSAEVVVLDGLCVGHAESPPEGQDGCSPSANRPPGTWAHRAVWSSDGKMIAAAVDAGFAAWDATTGRLIHAGAGDRDSVETHDLAFSPDSKQLIVTHPWSIRAIDTQTWETVVSKELYVDGGYHVGLAGFTSDGSTLLTIGAFDGSSPGAIHWLAAPSLDVMRSNVNVHEGIRTAAMDPTGVRIVTGGADGLVRVWDVATGDLIHEIPFGDTPIHGVAFVGYDQVAVTPADGDLVIVTLDPRELVDIVRRSLTRGFTLPECERFGFGAACPTLAELGRTSSLDASEVDGTYRMKWEADELDDRMVDAMVSLFGVEPITDADATDLASFLAGSYSITFAKGRFDITNDRRPEPFCTGTYTVRDDRVSLSSERGWWCGEVKLFDSSFVVDDGGLRFGADGFRGQFPDEMLFTSREWRRVGRREVAPRGNQWLRHRSNSIVPNDGPPRRLAHPRRCTGSGLNRADGERAAVMER